MDKSKINEWLQLAASVGVILSLIFVGLEIQQSRDIAIADIYQQKTAILIDQLAFGMPAEKVYYARLKARSGEDLSAEDEFNLYISLAARIAYWENNHFQFQMGLMTEEQWQASRNSIARRAKIDPNFLVAWARERPVVRRSFAEAVDQILMEEGIESIAR
jgi:hypothetical protein